MTLGRRAFLRTAAAAAVAAACAPATVKASPTPEPPLGPPETTTIRIHGPLGCGPWIRIVVVSGGPRGGSGVGEDFTGGGANAEEKDTAAKVRKKARRPS
ncbi:MAG: twin-arginine translocation signal domain-containing protein, partial [Candidatus Limnocylindria bacterium]